MSSGPTLREAFWVWLKIGLLGFGGPAGQIALLHQETVERRGWIEEERFDHALAYCMLLPGPEAQQLATYIGWLLHGTKGGIVAGLLFVAPGFLLIMALSAVYVIWGDAPSVEVVLLGLKAAVVGVVVSALARIAGRGLKSRAAWIIAGGALIALSAGVGFPIVVAGAAAAGWALLRSAPPISGPATTEPLIRSLTPVLVWTLVWIAPLGVIAALVGGTPASMALFFSQTAVVGFGGAYAVLAYVSQVAVDTFGWLRPEQMLDGLGLAETTPGPLILVLVFVGFVGAFQSAPEGLEWIWAIAGGFAAAWATFTPSFLWIFAGAPQVEKIRSVAGLNRALSGVSAAVVGAVTSLTLWFTGHFLFDRTLALGPSDVPDIWSVRPAEAVLAGLSVLFAVVLRQGVVTTILICVAAAVAARLTGFV